MHPTIDHNIFRRLLRAALSADPGDLDPAGLPVVASRVVVAYLDYTEWFLRGCPRNADSDVPDEAATWHAILEDVAAHGMPEPLALLADYGLLDE